MVVMAARSLADRRDRTKTPIGEQTQRFGGVGRQGRRQAQPLQPFGERRARVPR